MLLFPQFIKYKTFELLWNLDITWGLIWDLKEINFERGFRMDIVLEVSEIEDYSEFPNIEIQTVEIISKNKQVAQHREGRSLASEVSTANKAIQTIQTQTRRVWRKIKRKANLKQQNAYQTTTRSSSSTHTQRTSRIFRENEELCKTSRRRNQQGKNQTAFRSAKGESCFETERESSDRSSRRIEDQSRFIFNTRGRIENKRRLKPQIFWK